MNQRFLSAAVCLSLTSFLAAAPLTAGDFQYPDFDQGASAYSVLETAQSRSKAAPDFEGRAIMEKKTTTALATTASATAGNGEGSLWVSIGRADLAGLRAKDSPLSTAPVAQNDRAALFQVSPDLLPRLSAFMHQRFNRCGGFFTHATRAEAEKDLAAPVSAAAVSYTIDQQAVVGPLVSRVQEANLRGTIETLAAYNNRYYTADSGVEAARWIQGRWQALAGNLPGASVQLVSHPDWKQPSVVLTIPGAEKPDDIVVLGGHLDSINGYGDEEARAPGADDNASGIAVLTEAVRILGEAGVRPRRTIQFMGYSAEEVGLRGSQEIAQQYAQAGKKVIGVIQYDMTNFKGAGDVIYFLSDNVNAEMTAFLGKLVEAYAGVTWSTIECGYACSDHASWTRSGFPASAAFESTMEAMNHNLHTDHDTLAASGGNAEHSVAFAKLAVAFAMELAKTAPLPALRAAKGP